MAAGGNDGDKEEEDKPFFWSRPPRADAGTSSTSTGGPPDATSYRSRYALEVTTTTASAETATAVTAPRPLWE